MALANYADLQATALNWLAEVSAGDQSTMLPDYVTLVEADLMYGDPPLRVDAMRVSATASLASGATGVTVPSDWLESVAVYIQSPRVALRYLAPDEFHRIDSSELVGVPEWYTREDGQLRITPRTDGSSYTIELVYYQQIPALASNSTNWLLTESPNVYLYGVLAEAQKVLVDEKQLAVFQKLYAQAKAGVIARDRRAQVSGSPLIVTTDYAVV